jgi:hypothetical protein
MMNIDLNVKVLNFRCGSNYWIEELRNNRTREIINPYIEADIELSEKDKNIFCLRNILLYCTSNYFEGDLDPEEIIKESKFGKMEPGSKFIIRGPIYKEKGTEYPFDTYIYRIADYEDIESDKEWISENEIEKMSMLLVPWERVTLNEK